VEGEIKAYPAIKKEYESVKDDIINETPIMDGEIRGSNPGSVTEEKAIKIITSKRLADMERKIKAIEAVYKSLTGERKQCMEEIWLDRYTNGAISYRLGVSEKSIKRWKRQIVYRWP
jgi:RinA family phage transcriptional activator